MPRRSWTRVGRWGLILACALIAAGPLGHAAWELLDPRLPLAASYGGDGLDLRRRLPLDPWGQPYRNHLNDHVGGSVAQVLQVRASWWRGFAAELRRASADPADRAFADRMDGAARRELESERRLRSIHGDRVDDPTFLPYAPSYERQYCHHRPVIGESLAAYSYGPNGLDDLAGGDDVLLACQAEPYFMLYARQAWGCTLLGAWLLGLILIARLSDTCAGRLRDVAESVALGTLACLVWGLAPDSALTAPGWATAATALAVLGCPLLIWAFYQHTPRAWRTRGVAGLCVVAALVAAWLLRGEVVFWRDSIAANLAGIGFRWLFPWDHPWGGRLLQGLVAGLACGWGAACLTLHLLRLQHQPRDPGLLHALREQPSGAIRVVVA